MEERTVPVVFSTDENYVFMTAVSIYSLIKHMDPQRKCDIYVLIDSSLSQEGRRLLQSASHFNRKCSVHLREMNNTIFTEARLKIAYLTRATLYRLLLPWILTEYDKCVYLDGDTLILSDISEMLDWEMRDHYLAGVLDDEEIRSEEHARILEIDNADTYVNAGVLVMELKKLRDAGLRDTFLMETQKGYVFADQDILNKHCYGKIALIPQRYNSFSFYKAPVTEVAIRHYAGGPDVRPWYNLHSQDVSLWWNYADFFADSRYYAETKRHAEEYMRQRDYRALWRKCSQSDRIFIWGYTKRSRKLCDALRKSFPNTEIAFVDSDQEKQKQAYEDMRILAPDEISRGEGVLFINTAVRRGAEITEMLLERGISADSIAQFGEKNKSYYRVLDEMFYREEFEDLLLFHYGLL